MNAICIYRIVVVVVLLGTVSVTLGAGDTWTQKADMPTGRLGLATAVVNGKIYAIGGYASAHTLGKRTVEEYDPATDTWTTKADMPTGRHWLSASVVNGKIYVIGGSVFEYTGLSVVEEYDPATDMWTQKAPVPTARLGHAASVVNGIIYVISGFTEKGTQPLRTVEAYDPLTDTWTTKAEINTGRYFPSASVVGGKIYVIGGAGSSPDVVFSTVEEYDPATDTWTTITNMPEPRFSLSSITVNGKIYVIGGRSGNQRFSTVEEYDPVTDIWASKASMPRPKGAVSASEVNGKIYVIGGTEGATSTWPHPGVRTVYEYDATPPLVVDFNSDGIVDILDLCIMVDHWGDDYPLCDIGPTPFGDGIVDIQDLNVLTKNLLEDYPLVANWMLDETEGSIALDSVGDNDGALNGYPFWLPKDGMTGGALLFDGVDDYVETLFILDPSKGPFSVFAWIQGGAPGQVIISQHDGTGTGNTWLGLDAEGGALMTGLVAPRSGWITPKPLVSESIITDIQWHHVGFVWDGSYRALYVDGIEVAKDTAAQNPLKSADGGMYIGVGKDLDTGTFFSGMIDDVRIYDVALTAEEIAAMAQ